MTRQKILITGASQRPIRVSVMEPGYIESEITAKSQTTMFQVDNETGVKSLVAAIEREPGRAAVPWWPWGADRATTAGNAAVGGQAVRLTARRA
jgi:NAD(P)-dependent dehydrogenase (short-subunit alcohol dehydrogenase family)